MKRILLAILGFMALLTSQETFAQIGMGTENPDRSAVLDLESTRRGLLIPRISIGDLNNANPVTLPAKSLLVYNTNNTTGEGFYYWDGGKWVALVSDLNEAYTEVIAGQNIKVDADNSGEAPKYTVSIQGGQKGELLVSTDNGGTAWIDAKQILDVQNGISFSGINPAYVELGGDLTRNTEIATGAYNFKITGLEENNTPDRILVMKNDGTLEYMDPDELKNNFSANLTTDGKIVIGNNESTTTTLDDAVLVATELSIKKESIGTTELTDNAVTTDKILKGADGTVLVTKADGTVDWIDQSALANKDSYTGLGVVDITENGTSTTGGKNYDVSVATAGTELGVVKQAATDAKVVIDPNGVLDINPSNIILEGNVTGPLNANTVVKLQGRDLAATQPDAGQALVWNATDNKWEPSTLDASVINGKQLKSDGSITISDATNKALLEELDIKITPGAKDQVLVTNEDADGTEWKDVNDLVNVSNGLHKDATTKDIHLGGVLVDETTTITTAADKTLAIAGLQSAVNANQYVVAEDVGGVLRTVAKSISGTDATVASINGYSPHIPEVQVKITLANSDVNLVLPSASDAIGQTINVQIVNTTDAHTGYLNVKDTYGSMPYQGWILKSNGSDWYIASRY